MAKRKILIIDDEPSLRKLMKFNLERTDEFEVTTAASGAEGIQIANETVFDLVITDFNMPGIDGSVVLEVLKAKTPNCPVLLFSVYHDDPSTIRPDILKRADGLISKPLNHEQMYRAIQRALAKRAKGTP